MEIPSKQSNLHARCNPDNLPTTLSFTKNLLSLVYISKQIRIIGTKKKGKREKKEKKKIHSQLRIVYPTDLEGYLLLCSPHALTVKSFHKNRVKEQ